LNNVRGIAVLFAALAATSTLYAAQPNEANYIDDFTGKPRLLVLTDIGNEPDDQMSMVRLLMYSNELDIEGLVATTSTWQRERVQPETIRRVIAAYGEVQPNLLKHAPGWPEPKQLAARVSPGQPAFGMAAVGPDKSSPGAKALIAAADREDPRPLWITVWGGANTLAQALLQVRAERSPEQLTSFVSKLRVYSISDQDDAGPWIRHEFPTLHYIVKPSPPNSYEYLYASWTGISGDVFYRNCAGADPTLVTNAWLDQNIRSKGPLGHAYPRFAYIMEGDTPSFLGLLDNGLNAYRNAGWGGWGGRYLFHQPYGETRAIWSQGGDADSRLTSQDEVTGVDGRKYFSDQATVWRWREAFQHDFAARMNWTVKPYAAANHNPLAIVNGVNGTSPIYLTARVGETIDIEAGASRDPDGNTLSFNWFHYPEAGFAPGQGLAAIEIAGTQTSRARIRIISACRPDWLRTNKACASGVAHVILAVTDNGTPSLTSYRRVILTVTANP
jgi:hypothetical protein